MTDFRLADLVNDHTFVTGFANAIFGQTSLTIPPDRSRNLLRRLPTYIAALDAADLRITRQHAQTVLTVLESSSQTSEGSIVIEPGAMRDLQIATALITEGIKAELNTKAFVAIPPNRHHLFEDGKHFGDAVAERFPSLTFNINEAGKCMALVRWTAGAFHSILCLEAAIRAVARHLGVPDPTTGVGRNWSQVSRTVEDAMNAKWPDKADKMRSEYVRIERIYAALKSTINPYRNETMHLSSRYDENEAALIFEMSKGILQQVAAICDEDGLPKA